MLRKKIALLTTVLTLTLLTLLLVPMLFGRGAPMSICDMGVAAQEGDELCTDEHATIEAFYVVAAQATVDASAHGTQIAALQAECNIAPETEPEAEVLSFNEDFANNSKGWVERETQVTSVRLVDGQLMVGAAERWFMMGLVPQLRADNFYAEVTMTTPYEQSIFVGFAVGNGEVEPTHFHLLLVGSDWDEDAEQFVWYVRRYLWDGFNLALETEATYERFWQAGEPVRMALEAKDGRYTLLVKGRETQIYEFASFGNQIGLAVYAPPMLASETTRVRVAFFDNLSIVDAAEEPAP